MINVIHADDHELVTNSVKKLVERHAKHIKVVATVQSYQELFSALEKFPCDILLLDAVIIGGTPTEYLPLLKTVYPNLKIILFWVFADEESLTKWFHLLDGHLHLGVNSHELIAAIEKVANGEKYFTIAVPIQKK